MRNINICIGCNKLILAIACFSFSFITYQSTAQERLYHNEFDLREVKLLDGPFKDARDLNIKVLLEYDVDRLLAPYRKEAGLPAKAKSYPNWEGLDGHIGGHYLSAMAINAEATGSEECLRRLEYMISELKLCQEENEKNNPGWGNGYAGGVPNSAIIWSTLKEGDLKAFRSAWVPWYNLHKMYAGLRDAWLYTGNEEARTIFLKFCDWGINITSGLNDTRMQSMLDTEHGGMNEIFADAFQMTGDMKYQSAAMRFSHQVLLDAMAGHIDNLDNKHANTQVPKAIGFQRIGEVTNESKYKDAAGFFWKTVTENRSLAFGGNSRREFFPGANACIDFVNDVEGPESCNSYNMLKLTEDLFRERPVAGYIDYYERTLFNHILSTQNPEHGGYVYFTPVRPRHYRVYSKPNEAMWCCVGSGMENHGKYNQLIYTHIRDTLFINLFIPSELNWKEKGITLRQETTFPDEEKTRLSFTCQPSKFVLMVRYPSWVDEGKLKINVNGKSIKPGGHPSSYVQIDRLWKSGDNVEIFLPMHNSIEHLPNVPSYIAFMHGPILLGAKTGNEDLKGLVADDSRWGHIPSGKKLPVDQAPIIISDKINNLTGKLLPVKGKPLSFSVSAIKFYNQEDFLFEPFYRIHDSRYMIYWKILSENQLKSFSDSLSVIERERLELQGRTVDFVAPGEQQPEADHMIKSMFSNTGNYLDKFWRDARNEGFFSYELSTRLESGLSLVVRYWGNERGNRKFDIYIDDIKLLTENNTGKWNKSVFIQQEYMIPDSLLTGKKQFRVKFQALPGNSTSSVYFISLTRKKL